MIASELLMRTHYGPAVATDDSERAYPEDYADLNEDDFDPDWRFEMEREME